MKKKKLPKRNILSKLVSLQTLYNIMFKKLNSVLKQKQVEIGTKAKSFLPKQHK